MNGFNVNTINGLTRNGEYRRCNNSNNGISTGSNGTIRLQILILAVKMLYLQDKEILEI